MMQLACKAGLVNQPVATKHGLTHAQSRVPTIPAAASNLKEDAAEVPNSCTSRSLERLTQPAARVLEGTGQTSQSAAQGQTIAQTGVQQS
jgi:hypothetical protein